jgi:hypothetical protein
MWAVTFVNFKKFAQSGNRCCDFFNIFAKYGKKLAFMTENKAKLCKNVVITLVFKKNANFLQTIGENRGKLAKIGKNRRKSAKIGKIGENRLKLAKIAENRRKSQKLVIITSTPGHPAPTFQSNEVMNGMKLVWLFWTFFSCSISITISHQLFFKEMTKKCQRPVFYFALVANFVPQG